jgi:hypothetical protein
MGSGGAKTWYFPDGYLPEKVKNGSMEAHEALMLFNSGLLAAEVKLDFYFEDKPPVKDVAVTVGPERVRSLRLDQAEKFGGPALPPLTQYALRVRSSVPIVVQFGRLDTTQNAMAYYVGVGFAE